VKDGWPAEDESGLPVPEDWLGELVGFGSTGRVRRRPPSGGLLGEDRLAGRTGLEPATLCSRAPMSAIVPDASGAAEWGAGGYGPEAHSYVGTSRPEGWERTRRGGPCKTRIYCRVAKCHPLRSRESPALGAARVPRKAVNRPAIRVSCPSPKSHPRAGGSGGPSFCPPFAPTRWCSLPVPHPHGLAPGLFGCRPEGSYSFK
jgi:hypothetical protein